MKLRYNKSFTSKSDIRKESKNNKHHASEAISFLPDELTQELGIVISRF